MVSLLDALSEWTVLGGLLCSGPGFTLVVVIAGAVGTPEPHSICDWLAAGGLGFSFVGFMVGVSGGHAPSTTTAVVLGTVAALSTVAIAVAGWYSLRSWRTRRKALREERRHYHESLCALSGEVYRALTAARDGEEPLTEDQKAVIRQYSELSSHTSREPAYERERIERLHVRLSKGATAGVEAVEEQSR